MNPSGHFARPQAGSVEVKEQLRVLGKPIVAIDGVAGAGKSTTSRRVAAELGLMYLDTGAMYRAATVAVLRRLGSAKTTGLFDADDRAITRAVQDCMIAVSPDGRVTLDGDDITEEIRGKAVTEWVSRVSAVQGVRDLLVPLQRELAAGGAVVEGRDIGTVVFPNADVKIFLTAEISERARRRAAERDESSIEDIANRLAARDQEDSMRSISPLVPAADAVVIDTTNAGIEEVVGHIVRLCAKAGLKDE